LKKYVHKCGSCTVCCVDLHIRDKSYADAFGEKPPGVPCTKLKAHASSHGMCTVWDSDEKPSVCRDFSCGYMDYEGFGRLAPGFRPDRSGIVFYSAFVEEYGMAPIILLELKMGALQTSVGNTISLMCSEYSAKNRVLVVTRTAEDDGHSERVLSGPRRVVATAEMNRRLYLLKGSQKS